MKSGVLFLAAVLFIVIPGVAGSQMSDYKNYTDPPLFTRMPNYFLSNSGSFKENQFDAYMFRVKKGNKTERQRIEGHWLKYIYYFNKASGAVPPSYLQIARNYQNAAAKMGGEVLFEDGTWTTIRVAKNNLETWVEVERLNVGYGLLIVERQTMQQDVAANAEGLQKGLSEKGHVEVSGIFFDFGKADLKPESEAALKEIAKLLTGTPALKVWVVGHTDSVGSVDANLKLSSDRATAVAAALRTMGIDPGRLAPYGAGPYAPVATNATDEGRAMNRRVELVAQP
jgi:OmpA-OmpF porin, OOP family